LGLQREKTALYYSERKRFDGNPILVWEDPQKLSMGRVGREPKGGNQWYSNKKKRIGKRDAAWYGRRSVRVPIVTCREKDQGKENLIPPVA